jgi:hypothetical protein
MLHYPHPEPQRAGIKVGSRCWGPVDAMGNWLYLIGLSLVIAGVLLGLIGRLRVDNSVRARYIAGNTVAGNVSGTVSQNARIAAAEGGKKAAEASKPDRVAWLIAIIGALIAAAQLAHDVLAA